MPWWGWVLIGVVALAIFIPIKIKSAKWFLAKMKAKEKDNVIDE